ncbi:hypothetical protein MN116_006593 [Schistosoma mekongi]|uniref:Uncharacterized protein n=1 Tax=Schistosoma mekongi TaxID=38744 RepID=A0AAE2D2V0_SCHME|nr:hypothetical protein MN116_006593 [Schistosoma mekongi]
MGYNEFIGVDIVKELQFYVERQVHGIESQRRFNRNSSDSLDKLAVRLTSGIYPMDRHSASLVSKAVKNLYDELDQVILCTLRHPGIGKMRMTSIIQNLERTVRDLCDQYLEKASAVIGHASVPSIKLGSVYAWAREQSGVNFNNLQMCSDLRRNRLRLCRKLCRLVRLSKSSKQRNQSHPALVDLRHDLMKIRSRATTAKISTGKPVFPSSDNAFVSFDKPIVQSKLATVFSKLTDQITDLLLPISHLIPGISIVKSADDAAKRRESLRAQVLLAIQGFYSHFNETTEDSIYEFKQSNSVHDDENPVNQIYDLSDSFDSGSDDIDIFGSKLSVKLNPAAVQASLDRYDHFNWNKQKQRCSLNRSKEHIVEQQSTNLQQPTSKCVKSPTTRGKVELTELTLDNTNIKRPIETNNEVQLITDVSMESDSEVTRTEEDEKHEETNQPDDYQEKSNNSEYFNKSTTRSHSNSKVSSGFTRKHAKRSLRLRHSRTPSDASCSEGEVLSDTEEDHDLTDNDDLVEADDVGVHEKMKSISVTDCQNDLVRLMHDPLKADTPISDVDLTELEIMDEWGLPTVSSSTNRLDTSIALSDISLPAEELKIDSKGKLNEMKLRNDAELTQLFNESLEFCAKHLHDLIIQAESGLINKFNDTIVPTTMPNQLQSTICLSPELEASIERTSTAFKEHINSVLTNLLHTASSCKSSSKLLNGNSKSHNQHASATAARRQQMASRRGSRLRGMLLAYQQDAVKKRFTSKNLD